MDADDTRPSTPRAKLSTHNRLQVRELVRTWLEMAPRRHRARVEYADGVLWAIVADGDGHTGRAPIGEHDDVWHAWGRAKADLPTRKEPLP